MSEDHARRRVRRFLRVLAPVIPLNVAVWAEANADSIRCDWARVTRAGGLPTRFAVVRVWCSQELQAQLTRLGYEFVVSTDPPGEWIGVVYDAGYPKGRDPAQYAWMLPP